MVSSAYHRPSTLQEALELLGQDAPRILAGGTDLFPATQRAHLAGPLLDITGIEQIRGVAEMADHWRIGAATRWSDILAADLPPAFDALKLSAREVGSVQIQNSGTIGGNLCNASPAADGVPPLLVLDAQVELTSRSGSRLLPLPEFLQGNRKTARQAGEILTAIHVPKSSCAGRSNFVKLGARKYLVISIVMVAARITCSGSKITAAALAVGSCSATAQRLFGAERALIGMDLTRLDLERVPLIEALSPIDDIRADAVYRREAAATLIRRALEAFAS